MPEVNAPDFSANTSAQAHAEFYRAGEAAKQGNDGLLAIVEGRNIRVEDLADAIAQLPKGTQALDLDTLYPIVLDNLVSRAAVLNAASKVNFDHDPDVQRRMQSAANQVLALEYLHHIINGQVTEPAIHDRYLQQYGKATGIPETRVRVILVRDEEQARQVIAELDKGADFATLARARSIDTSGPNGGDVGFVRSTGLGPLQVEMLHKLKPGEYSPYPVRDRLGWSVIKVEERREAPVPTFEQIHDEIQQQLTEEAISAVVAKIREDTRMRVFNLNGTPVEEDMSVVIDPALR